MPFLTSDIYSPSNRKLYGKAGDDVKIISESGNAVIAEDKYGNRFPVPAEKISSTPTTKTIEEPIPSPVVNGKKNKKVIKENIQKSFLI